MNAAQFASLAPAGLLARLAKTLRGHRQGVASSRDATAEPQTAPSTDLAAERARLARAQAEAQEMKNAVARRELAPVHVIEWSIARVGRQIAAILEALPVGLKRRCPQLTADDLAYVTDEINRARNAAANMDLSFLDDELQEVRANRGHASLSERIDG